MARKQKPGMEDLLRIILRTAGIDIQGELIFLKRVLGKGLSRNIRIYSIETFVRLFSDGYYFLEGYNVTINNIEPAPFYINYVCINAEYEDNEWTVNIRTDEEEITYEDIDKLENRAAQLVDKAHQAFRVVSAIADFASKAWDVVKSFPPSQPPAP